MPRLSARLDRRRLLTTSLTAGALAAAAPALRSTPPRAFAAPSTPAPPTSPASPVAREAASLFRELDAVIEARMAELKVPGVAVGVIVGEHEHTAGFGVTNLEHPLTVDADTLFQIGSTTKTFTGTAIARLIEQGQLDLAAPVRTYLPDFRVAAAEASERATVRHLLTHTAGWFGDDFTDPGDGDDALARYVAEMADIPQIAPLGQHFSYNNAAFAAAGRVIEAVTDQTYEAAVAELVFAPLGMAQSFFFPEEVMTAAFAVGHGAPSVDPDGQPTVLAPWAIPRSMAPAGGVVSSVADQLRYARFHLGDGTADGARLLSTDGLRRMHRPHGPGGSLGPWLLDGVGVGWLLTTVGGVPVVGHGGSTNGQQSTFILVPERGFAVTVLTNANAGAILGEEITTWALDRFLGLTPDPITPLTVPPARLTEYAGEYRLPDGTAATITFRADGLEIETTSQGQPIPEASGRLAFAAPDRVFLEVDGLRLLSDFVRRDDGTVGWLRSGRMAPKVG